MRDRPLLDRHVGLLAVAAFGLTACVHQGQATSEATSPAEAGLVLPPGPGRALLERECLNCHELEAVELFSDFYNLDLWRSLVLTMRGNGARLDDTEVETIAEYLARNFGTGVD